MSRRYGRNQRRRARDERSRLCRDLLRAQQDRQLTKALLREAEHELDEARSLLPSFSALFAPEPLQLRDAVRERIVLRSQDLAAMTHLPVGASAQWSVQYVPMHVMLTDAVLDSVKGHLHCRVQFADGRWGYSVSSEALRSMPRKQLVGRLSIELARQIGRDLSRLPVGGRR